MGPPDVSRSRRWWVALLAAIPLVRLIFDVSRGFDHLIYHYLADDAFYYFVIAQHLPEFNQGISTSGFHPLYPVLIAPLHRLLSHELAIPGSLLILVAASSLSVVVLHRLLSWYWCEPIPLLSAAAWALNGNLYGLAMTGTETVLAGLGVLLCFQQAARIEADGVEHAAAWRFAFLGGSIGASFLARMDSPLMLAPLAAWLAVTLLARRRLAALAWLVVSLAAVALPWLFFMWAETGSFFPTSGAALRVLRGLDGAVFAGPEMVLRAWSRLLAGSARFLVAAPEALGSPVLWAALATAVAGAIVARRAPGAAGSRRRYAALLAGGLACWTSYYLFFQGGFRPWYFAYVGVGVFGLLLPFALSLLAHVSGPRATAWLGAALVVVTAFASIPGPSGTQEFDKYRSALAADPILRELGPGPRIGAFNTGVYNYFMSQDVINLDGVVNPFALEALRRGELADYIRAMDIGYLIEHDLGTARNLKRIARDPRLELERWIDLTGFYEPYADDYAKRTYLWKVRPRRAEGHSDAPD